MTTFDLPGMPTDDADGVLATGGSVVDLVYVSMSERHPEGRDVENWLMAEQELDGEVRGRHRRRGLPRAEWREQQETKEIGAFHLPAGSDFAATGPSGWTGARSLIRTMRAEAVQRRESSIMRLRLRPVSSASLG